MPAPSHLHVTRGLALVALVVAALLLAVNLYAVATVPDGFVDMRILFGVIEGWWSGEATLYPGEEVLRLPGVPSYRYPPVWAVSMVPLVTTLELRTAILVWGAASLAVFAVGLGWLMRSVRLSPTAPAGVAVLLTLALFSPLYETAYGPTKELAMVGLVAAAFLLDERRRPLLAGAAFAGAILMKVYPVLFAPYFLVRRRVAMLLWSAVWLVALNLLPLPLIGVGDTWAFWVDVFPMQSGSTADAENAGFEMLLMAIGWLAWFEGGTGAFDPLAFPAWPATLWRVALLGGYVALALVAGRRGVFRDSVGSLLFFSTWTAAVLMSIPVSWVNYQIWLALPLIGLVAWLRDAPAGPGRLAIAVLLVVALLPMTVPVKSVLLSRYVYPGLDRATVLSSNVGKALEGELEARVAAREAVLAGVASGALDARVDVPDASSRGPAHERLAAEVAAIEQGRPLPPGSPGPGLARARLRAAGLATGELIGLTVLRAAAGLLVLLVGFAACARAVAGPQPGRAEGAGGGSGRLGPGLAGSRSRSSQ